MPDLQPTCTCNIAIGSDPVQAPIRNAISHKDAKGRPICQVHYPVDKNEYESRALSDSADDIPRTDR